RRLPQVFLISRSEPFLVSLDRLLPGTVGSLENLLRFWDGDHFLLRHGLPLLEPIKKEPAFSQLPSPWTSTVQVCAVSWPVIKSGRSCSEGLVISSPRARRTSSRPNCSEVKQRRPNRGKAFSRKTRQQRPGSSWI